MACVALFILFITVQVCKFARSTLPLAVFVLPMFWMRCGAWPRCKMPCVSMHINMSSHRCALWTCLRTKFSSSKFFSSHSKKNSLNVRVLSANLSSGAIVQSAGCVQRQEGAQRKVATAVTDHHSYCIHGRHQSPLASADSAPAKSGRCSD
jgi:hypothetical protein